MWLVRDRLGSAFVAATYAALLSSHWILCRWTLPVPFGPTAVRGLALLHRCGCLLCFWAHTAAMLTNPGTLSCGFPGVAEELGAADELCKKCGAVRSAVARAHHCSVCGRCIEGMDHHCVFINNCVGAGNVRHFLLFLLYSCAYCGGSLVLAAVSAASCAMQLPPKAPVDYSMTLGADGQLVVETAKPSVSAAASAKSLAMFCNPSAAFAWALGGVVALGLVFGLLAVIMLWDAVDHLAANRSTIDRLKGVAPDPRPVREALHEAMGAPPSWRWLVPPLPEHWLMRAPAHKRCPRLML